jgi:hypothetical protein
MMRNLIVFWFIVWPQVINKILFVWGPISSSVKSLTPQNRDQSFDPSDAFIHS